MSPQSKRELVEGLRAEYWKAGREGKKHILDTVCSATGYNRKYAIGLLRSRGRKGSSKPSYLGFVQT